MGEDVKKEENVEIEIPIEPKNVLLDKRKLNLNLVKLAEKEVSVPQLNKLMGLGDGEIAVIKVRQLNLDEYLYCQNSSEDKLRNLMEGIVAAAEKAGEVKDEVLSAFRGLSLKSKYYIDICVKGTVEPELGRKEWIFLARMYPLVVEKIAGEIIVLTKGGAELKKNS